MTVEMATAAATTSAPRQMRPPPKTRPPVRSGALPYSLLIWFSFWIMRFSFILSTAGLACVRGRIEPRPDHASVAASDTGVDAIIDVSGDRTDRQRLYFGLKLCGPSAN